MNVNEMVRQAIADAKDNDSLMIGTVARLAVLIALKYATDVAESHHRAWGSTATMDMVDVGHREAAKSIAERIRAMADGEMEEVRNSSLGITPGDWEAKKQHGGHWMIGTPPSAEVVDMMKRGDFPITMRKIAEVVGSSGYVTGQQGEANARLMADAGTTANKCGLLPSELLAQRDEFLDVLIGRLWLVWSNEHGAWWGKDRRGYCTDIEAAGRYTLSDAIDCCDTRSQVGDVPPEMIQPSPEWHEARAAAIARCEGARK